MDFEALQAYRDQNSKIRMVSDEQLIDACAMVTFCYSFLVDGLGFKNSSRQLIFLEHVKNQSITVADGIFLKHVNQLPWKLNLQLEEDTQKEVAIPSFAMGFLGTLVGYAFIVMLLYIRRHMCRPRFHS